MREIGAGKCILPGTWSCLCDWAVHTIGHRCPSLRTAFWGTQHSTGAQMKMKARSGWSGGFPVWEDPWASDLVTSLKKKARKGVRRQWCRREATLCSLLPSSQGVEARLVNVQAPVPSETKRVPVKKVVSFQMLTAECQTKSRALPSVRPLWLTGLTSLKPSVARETLLKRPRSPYLGRNACSGQKVGLSEFWQQVIFIEHLVWASPPTPPIILCVLTDLLLQGSSSYYLHFRGKEFGAQRS